VEQINSIHDALDRLIRRTGYSSSSYYNSNSLSTSCQRFIAKSKRKAECYDDVIYGEIMSFTFWNMNYAKSGSQSPPSRYSSSQQQPSTYSSYSYNSYQQHIKIKENVTTDGLNVCQNIPLNVEANVNPCVKTVHFKLRGWSYNSTKVSNNATTTLTMDNLLMKYERIDDRHPMYLFNTTTYASTHGGRYLLPGSYTLTATPDQFRSKQKTLRFNVIKC
jgi:hypothetical protein